MFAGILVLNCGSNKKATNPNPRPELESPIPVGSIHVRLKIVGLNLDKNMLRGELTEVLGYGANTEPLKIGTELHCIISENVNTESFKEEELIDVQVRKAPPGMGMEHSMTHWAIVKLFSTK